MGRINLHFEGQLVKKPSFLEVLYTPNPTRSCSNKLARPDLGHAQACTVSSGSSTALGWKVCVGAGGLTWPHLYGLLKSRSESTHLPHPAVEGEAAKVPGSQGWPKPDHSTNPLKHNLPHWGHPWKSIMKSSSILQYKQLNLL